ncbi:MAG: hypothetical protein MUD10_05420, partial [Candidatus Pacebacteria bacterium]|nr:hypothetical protein [Candidatus Paceibacterota bacterium]
MENKFGLENSPAPESFEVLSGAEEEEKSGAAAEPRVEKTENALENATESAAARALVEKFQAEGVEAKIVPI